MIKLYRFSGSLKEYWEAWKEASGAFTVHWGELGTQGHRKTVKNSFWTRASKSVEAESKGMIAEGFDEIEPDAHRVVIVEYAVEGMGTAVQLDKRHRLEERLNATLGWTGLGAVDGGSIGSGTMEVCAFVVDFDLAKKVIEADLVGTEFADYTRIYDEQHDD